MIQSLGRRLSLIFDRGAESPDLTGATPPGAAVFPPLVDFVAYAEDCVLSIARWGPPVATVVS